MILKNHRIVITGAGRGIGRVIACRAASAGADLVLISRHIDQLQQTRDELESLKPPSSKIMLLELDIRCGDEVCRQMEKLRRDWGGVEGLINNAGIQPPIGSFSSVNPEEWKRNVEINLFGTIHCCHAVLPMMMEARYGKIINLSGGGSTSPRPNFSAYGVAKTAVVRFSETLAEEVRDYHIDVNAISPGAINTGMLTEVLQAGEMAGKELEEARRRETAGGDDPNLAAQLCLFLLGNQSDGITGKLISARWDRWQDPEFQNQLRNDHHLATLRRIDQRNFNTVPQPKKE